MINGLGEYHIQFHINLLREILALNTLAKRKCHNFVLTPSCQSENNKNDRSAAF
jgi:hypothetical protein